MKKIFIVDPANSGWIIEKLMGDIKTELNKRGFSVRIGRSDEYRGEEVVFNSRYLDLFTTRCAIINSVFVTHVDDYLKELELKMMPTEINSLVSMSPSDAKKIKQLLNHRNNVSIIGINLPARCVETVPFVLTIFSACYADNRKNERWLIDYLDSRPIEVRNSFIFKLLGNGWSIVAGELERLDVNYEIIRYSVNMPDEYSRYKGHLANGHFMIYMGFDGGAMCVYDALNVNIPFLVPADGYHNNLEPVANVFKNKCEFFERLDDFHRQRIVKKNLLESRSIEKYVDRLIQHWTEILGEQVSIKSNIKTVSVDEPVDLSELRSNYKKIDTKRLMSFCLRMWCRFLETISK